MPPTSAGPLEDDEVVPPGPLQLDRGAEPGEAAADDDDVGFRGQRTGRLVVALHIALHPRLLPSTGPNLLAVRLLLVTYLL